MQTIAENLAALSDEQLLAEVKAAVARERDATIVLIMSLAEMEGRRLYLPLGFPSLYAYCTRELLLSKSAAYSRIHAARIVRAFPAALEYLADGSISFTNLNVLGPHLTADNHVALLQAAQYRTKEEVEQQVAALSPGAAGMVTIHLRVRAETREKLRRAQDLWTQSAPDGKVADLLDRALTLLVADLERKKLAEVKRPRRAKKVSDPAARHIPAWIRRTVSRRDGGRCKYVGTTGRCPETANLQFHHLHPREHNGPTTVENIELRCGPHNRYEYEIGFAGSPSVVRERPPAYGSYLSAPVAYSNSS